MEAVRTPRDIYADGMTVVERALAEAARAQWAGERPDIHRDRRRLIELRREVPNDREDPLGQAVRHLLTTYVSILDEQADRDRYERGLALSEELRAELARLRPRAAVQRL